MYSVAFIYGLGRTIYTFFCLKKGAIIYGRNIVPPSKSDISDLQHAYVHDLIHQDLWVFLVVTSKTVAKISPPKHCPDLHGLHFHRLTSTFHHHQPLNQTRAHIQRAHRIGGTKKYGLPKSHQEDTYGLTKSAKHRQHFILARRKWWLEKIRPFIHRARNDTSYEGLRPYYLLSLRMRVHTGRTIFLMGCALRHVWLLFRLYPMIRPFIKKKKT